MAVGAPGKNIRLCRVAGALWQRPNNAIGWVSLIYRSRSQPEDAETASFWGANRSAALKPPAVPLVLPAWILCY